MSARVLSVMLIPRSSINETRVQSRRMSNKYVSYPFRFTSPRSLLSGTHNPSSESTLAKSSRYVTSCFLHLLSTGSWMTCWMIRGFISISEIQIYKDHIVNIIIYVYELDFQKSRAICLVKLHYFDARVFTCPH